MNKNKIENKTAAEWLLFELSKNGLLPDGISSDIHNKAKETEKIQIIKAAASAYEDMFGTDGTEYGVQYYNKTFKSE